MSAVSRSSRIFVIICKKVPSCAQEGTLARPSVAGWLAVVYRSYAPLALRRWLSPGLPLSELVKLTR